MKKRPRGFLASIEGTEAFDYIVELHEYLWRFVRALDPGATGPLSNFVDEAIERLESEARHG